MTLLHQAAQKAVEAVPRFRWDQDMDVLAGPYPDGEWVRRADVIAALQQQPEPVARSAHMCGMQGFDGMLDICPACEARRAATPPALQHQEVPAAVRDAHGNIVLHNGREVCYRDEALPTALHQEVPREPVAVARPLTSEEEENAWNSITEQGCSCCTAAVRLFCRLNGITLSDAVLAASPSTTRQQEVGSDALGYATRLACSMWGQHYREEAPDWRPLPDLMGVLSQIDNMTTGLTKKQESGNKAARDVLAERHRQITAEGWSPEHDDQHAGGSMAFAAAAYAVHAHVGARLSSTLWNWTGWSRDWWKPKDARRDLVKAGALILAEIERRDRAAAPSTPENTDGGPHG